jgi:hypothetical protein
MEPATRREVVGPTVACRWRIDTAARFQREVILFQFNLVPSEPPQFEGVPASALLAGTECDRAHLELTRKHVTHNRFFERPQELCDALISTFDYVRHHPQEIEGLLRPFF